MYQRPGANRCPSRRVPPGSASRWNWLWWKARRRAAGGASRWNVITIWDAVCHSVRTCATGCGIAEQDLACLLWTSPAWKMQARDAWIGWNDEQRQSNLQAVVNNGRFLILPWVHVKSLASKILALSARQMPRDWETRYGCRPLLLETLVDAARYRGRCYRAANWILYVGQTAGRGRMDREHTAHSQAVKDIYLYPLVRDARQRLY